MVPCVAFVIQLHTILGELHFNNPQNALPPTPPGLEIVDVLYPETLSALKKFFLSNYIFLKCHFVVLAKGSAYEPFSCLGNIGNSCEVVSWGKYDSTQECSNWVSIIFQQHQVKTVLVNLSAKMDKTSLSKEGQRC